MQTGRKRAKKQNVLICCWWFPQATNQKKTIKHCYIKIVVSFMQEEKKPDCNGRELITKSVSTSTMTSKGIFHPRQFQFVLQNKWSVSKNLDKLEVHINSMSQKPEVVCLTETWFNPSYDNNCFSLNGYQTIISSNCKTRGGDVAFFLKNNINCQIVKKLETNSVQLLTVAFKTIKEQIWFSCIYMPPNCTNVANFLAVERYLDSLMIDSETKHVLCGDFNFNFLINCKKAESLKNLLAGNGLRISNKNEPTRVSNDRGTLIDAIFYNSLIETKVTST